MDVRKYISERLRAIVDDYNSQLQEGLMSCSEDPAEGAFNSDDAEVLEVLARQITIADVEDRLEDAYLHHEAGWTRQLGTV